MPLPHYLFHGDTLAVLPSRNPKVIFKSLATGAVLYNSADEVYFGLNPVGVRIWELLPPVNDRLEDVCLALAAEFPDVSHDVIRADVEELLDDLIRLDLVQPQNADASRAS